MLAPELAEGTAKWSAVPEVLVHSAYLQDTLGCRARSRTLDIDGPLLRDLDKFWGEVRGLEDFEQELEMMYQLHNGIPGNIVKIIMSTIEYFTAGLCDGPVWIRLRMQQILHPTRSLYTAYKMAEAETKNRGFAEREGGQRQAGEEAPARHR